MFPDVPVCVFCIYFIVGQVQGLFLPGFIFLFLCAVYLRFTLHRYYCFDRSCPELIFDETALIVKNCNRPVLNPVPVLFTCIFICAIDRAKTRNVITVLQKPFLVVFQLYYQLLAAFPGYVKSFF